jgi:hypothetical protein
MFGGSHPAVILDVPAMYTETDEIHQLLMRNYFAQALLDSGAVTCVLATGLRDSETMRKVHECLLSVLEDFSTSPETPGRPQLDILRQIAEIRSKPVHGDALFTRNPSGALAGLIQMYA